MCFALQADGKIVLGGKFTAFYEGTNSIATRNHIARINTDLLTLDSFDPNVGGSTFISVDCVVLQADGKILMGGDFTTTVGGIARSYIARVNADGTLDTSFNPNANGVVNCIAVQPDGKILLGGNFTTVGGAAHNRLARLNADGTLDTGFAPDVNGVYVYSIAVQVNGGILLGGNFTTVNGVGRNRIARVNANGTLDTGFDPNANNIVYGVSLQADGMVLVTGTFTTIQPNGAPTPTTRNYLARLLNDALPPQTLSVVDTAHILWTRGGTAPEVSRVTFELSTDGGTNWGAPIAATRIGTTANWQASGGFALPSSGQIRARGVTICGYQNGSSGIIEQVASFSGAPNGPEIVVTGNGVSIPTGDTTPGTADFTDVGAAAFGASTVVRTFTIANTGTGPLNLTGTPKVAVSGANAADFVVTTPPASPVAANGANTFQVTFTPGAVGVRNATLSIASDDADENPYTFAITGYGASFTVDIDGDGLNDAAEVMGAALGFNYKVSQPALVQTYNMMANGAGLFTTGQVQALNIGKLLISRNPTTSKFKLTQGLTRTTSLSPTNWLAFPFIQAGTSVNGQGKLEFEFTVPDNTAFFRLEAH